MNIYFGQLNNLNADDEHKSQLSTCLQRLCATQKHNAVRRVAVQLAGLAIKTTQKEESFPVICVNLNVILTKSWQTDTPTDRRTDINAQCEIYGVEINDLKRNEN